MIAESEFMVTVDDWKKRAVKKKSKQKILDSEPKLFGSADQLLRVSPKRCCP